MPKGTYLHTREHMMKVHDASRGKKRLPRSNDVKRKIALALLGRKRPDMVGNKFNLGKKQSEEAKRIKSEWAKRNNWFPPSQKGKPRPQSVIDKIVKTSKGRPHYYQRGANHPNWKGGITEINHKIRTSLEYRLWRTAVFERDLYTCRFCGIVGGRLNADHIKSFSQFPELRFAIDNGRTLCISCHQKTDTYGSKSIRK